MRQARHDWVLCLDADERAVAGARARRSARCSRAAHRRVRAYAMARRNRFLGRWLAHGEGYPDWTMRLFDRRRARWSDDPVHEQVLADGPVGRLAGDLLHASAESLDALHRQAEPLHDAAGRGAACARRAQLGAARMAASPLARFLRFYVLKLGFLDGAPGFAHIAIGAFASFLKHAKLRALERAARDP